MANCNITMDSFPQAYETYPTAVPLQQWPGTPTPGPVCLPAQGCFIASHVDPDTQFLQNTYLMRPDRAYGAGAQAVPIREGDLCRNT